MSVTKPEPAKAETPALAVKAAEKPKEQKSCFIIMPISNSPDYPDGHFDRVYEFIIKPACQKAGFLPTRADDVKSSNMIALDIVKRIVSSDMAICDLSSKNPNVLYEVGIRQAFDKPVVFMKDKKTPRIFDIQSFRDVGYDETLRVDTIEFAINLLTEAITDTYEDKDGSTSLVKLLGVEPAKVQHKTISPENSIVISMLRNLEQKFVNLDARMWAQQSPNANQVPNTITFGQFIPLNVIAINLGDRLELPGHGLVTVISMDPITNMLIVRNNNGLTIPVDKTKTLGRKV